MDGLIRGILGFGFDARLRLDKGFNMPPRDRIQAALILYEKVIVSVECEIDDMLNERYVADGSWNLLDYEVPEFLDPWRIVALVEENILERSGGE